MLLITTALVFDPYHHPLSLKTVGPAFWVLIPIAWGTAARLRADYLEAVHARAEIAERTREKEARHRVAEERMRIARVSCTMSSPICGRSSTTSPAPPPRRCASSRPPSACCARPTSPTRPWSPPRAWTGSRTSRPRSRPRDSRSTSPPRARHARCHREWT
ncbi:hypothetical protein [Streptomyces sp. NBC_01483]|uniref:hypothetical protein n=1 Tax=Streptomyces sp. NBC_01483 TaxID=2903883 RepID=UPI002E36CD00|nr:hypothetical protein [Streptomyces sp. NBC_01483]